MRKEMFYNADFVRFVSDFTPTPPVEKIQTYQWTDVDCIRFIYPAFNGWHKAKRTVLLLMGFLLGSDATGAFNQTITVVLMLKNGQEVVNRIAFGSPEHAQSAEQVLLELHRNSIQV